MLDEVVRAIADAIRNHQDTFVSGLTHSLSVLAGGLGALAVERWKRYGRLRVMLLEVRCDPVNYGSLSASGLLNAIARQKATTDFLRQIAGEREILNAFTVDLRIRILNEFAITKSISFQQINLHRRKPFIPLFAEESTQRCALPINGSIESANDDAQLAPLASQIFRLSAETKGKTEDVKELLLSSFAAIEVVVLVFPQKTVRFWLDIPADCRKEKLSKAILRESIRELENPTPTIVDSEWTPLSNDEVGLRAGKLAYCKQLLAEWSSFDES